MITRFLPLLPLLAGIGIFVAYVHPMYTGPISLLHEEIHGYERALAAAHDFNARQTELTASREAIAPDSLSRIEAFLPNGVDNVQLFLDLDALAGRTGLSLSDFDVLNAPIRTEAQPDEGAPPPAEGAPALMQAGPYDSLDISVTATGSYASFRAFLTSIERSLRLLDVTAVSINVAEGAPAGAYTYDIDLRLYWLR